MPNVLLLNGYADNLRGSGRNNLLGRLWEDAREEKVEDILCAALHWIGQAVSN